jgi:CheY-like chemotaxis protein
MKNVNEFMLMTINRCIDYTKASQGLKLVPRMETINFVEAINLPLRCMRDMQQDKKVELKLLTICSSVAENIITDKQWLQENILCLLSNAVKYSSSGDVRISVALVKNPPPTSNRERSVKCNTSFRPDRHIRIEIEDSGIGISEDMMSNLFNPFKQAQRLAGGTGLGLYSLAKRIEALDGSYGVKNRPDMNHGSVFWFTIPYRPDDTKQMMSCLSSPVASRTTSERGGFAPQKVMDRSDEGKLNILLVDDSLSILKMSSMMLRRQGHSVSTAENGAVALDMVSSATTESQPYDVILMDLQMPVMDGLEATTRIRALETIGVTVFSAHQLIIGVSACSDNETMEAAFSAGIDAFIPKPFTMQSFNDTYKDMLIKRHNA